MTAQYKVLIVDPNEAARKSLHAELENHSCVVEECAAVRDLVTALETFQPQIVFVSLDGAADGPVCVRQSAVHSTGPLVAAYASSQWPDAPAEAVRGGAHDFLTTPFDTDDIKGAMYRLSGALSKRSSRQFYADTLSSAVFEMTLLSASKVIAPAVHSICSLLTGFVEPRERMRVELALEEAIRNGFEHGNLGITFDEKTNTCDNGTFENLVAERSKAAQAAGKKLYIKVVLNPRQFSCRVRDDGKGFDWRKYYQKDAQLPAPDILHGRGMVVINKLFDSVSFNDKGNEITLTKLF